MLFIVWDVGYSRYSFLRGFHGDINDSPLCCCFLGPVEAKGQKGDRGEKGERGPAGPKGEAGSGSSSRSGSRGEKVWTQRHVSAFMVDKTNVVTW